MVSVGSPAKRRSRSNRPSGGSTYLSSSSSRLIRRSAATFQSSASRSPRRRWCLLTTCKTSWAITPMVFSTPCLSHHSGLNQTLRPSVAMVPMSGAFTHARPSAMEPMKGARTSSRARALVMIAGSCSMAASRERALHALEDGVGFVGDALAQCFRVAKLLGIMDGEIALDIGAQLRDARVIHEVQRRRELYDRPHIFDQAVAEGVLHLAAGGAAEQPQARCHARNRLLQTVEQRQ